MRNQRDAGRLLALCSKNNEEDVLQVFARRPEMPLRLEDCAAHRLNWLPKSENLKSLAAELGLGLESFLFLDDNPLECAEVEANAPEVLTLHLPEPEKIPQFLRHCWAFDHAKLTAEDRQRADRYRENRVRELARKEAASLADFIAGLELDIRIAPLRNAELPRAAQLTQRTNQFNSTTRRRNEIELQRLLADHELLAVKVSDRFGEYGLVGLMACRAGTDALEVDSFLLSCRVLGRGVEHRMLAALGEEGRKRGFKSIDVAFHPSPKNRPAFQFLESVGGRFRQAQNGGYLYRFPADFAAEVIFDPPAGGDAAGDSARGGAGEQQVVRGSDAGATRKFSQCRAIALAGGDLSEILAAMRSKRPLGAGPASGYAPPRTECERQLCALWEKLLRLERVGIHHNFFELGGHSLLAVRLFSEIEKIVGRKHPLVTLFQAPTVAELARVLEEESTHSQSPLVPIQPGGSRPPLFLVHGAGGDVLWGYANLAAHLDPDQPIYGIKSRGQLGLEEFQCLRDTAAYYLEAIRAFQPSGPYYLGGYCLGGNVAYEMARQLREEGESVGLLALFDTAPANAGYERMAWWEPGFTVRFARNLRYWLADFLALAPGERRRFVGRKSRALGRKLLRRLRRVRADGAVDLEEVIDPSHFPQQELKLWQAHLQALEQHVEQPYDGHVHLFRTRGQPLFCSLEEDFCWGRLARGGVTVIRVPGSHENIFMEANVSFLARALEAALAQTGIEAETPTETQPA